ncbi:hypothetical protein IV203_022428 [Nitzschia inconspicua]|uniref:Uncharacterized protein n=1 Tax=Nitzschia inconspicua TaxID=303405 RepID=A0A9K3K6F3_9STRA|nr:hypothetical protein IV203_024587 [Nitzschia inconspicua]KAG7344420.1 hypothetical protein IV203_022428 [Nitzschia inconspicua]
MISAAKKSAMKSVTPVVRGVVGMRKEIEPFTTTTTTAASRCPSDTNKEKDGMIQNSTKERQEENQSKNSSGTSQTSNVAETTTTTNVEKVENGHISNTTTTTTTTTTILTASNDDNDNESDSDGSSLVIGDGELDCTTSPSIENWISEYQSNIIPNVIHQHYPTITTTTTTTTTTGTTGPSDQDGTLQTGDPTNTIVSVLRQLDSSTLQQNGGAETNTMIETPQRSFIGRKRSSMTQQQQQQQRSPMTARMRKKNRTHETVYDQFEDAFEARQLKPVPPPNANFAQNHHHQHQQQQQQQQQQGHWGGTNPNNVFHPFSNMTSIATAGISGNAMTINPHEPFQTHQLLYKAAMYAAQEQQTQIIQQSKRRPKTQQEMIVMQAELDLVAAYQRVEALKQSSSSMGMVAAATSTKARTTTTAAAAAGGGGASANTGHRHHP